MPSRPIPAPARPVSPTRGTDTRLATRKGRKPTSAGRRYGPAPAPPSPADPEEQDPPVKIGGPRMAAGLPAGYRANHGTRQTGPQRPQVSRLCLGTMTFGLQSDEAT